MLIGLSDRTRRWRFVLLVVAIVTMFGIGATAAHGVVDAAEPAALAQEHADTCLVVGLVCAFGLAAVSGIRRIRPARIERLLAFISDMAERPRVGFVTPARAGAPPPSSARLCRFLI